MQRRTRSTLAALAGVGLMISLLGFATTPANAGAYTDEAAFGTHIDGSLSGTADNGVDWSVNVGSISHGQTMTYTFSEPVLVRFSVSGLNCQGEAAYVPEPAQLEAKHDNHTWDESNHRLAGAGASSSAESWFVIDEPVTSYSITGSSRSDCGRSTTGGTIWAFENVQPTIVMNTPADGAVYYIDQPVTADYHCPDPDNTPEEVSCLGVVPDGGAVDTSEVGDHYFGVIAYDEHYQGGPGHPFLLHRYTVKDVDGACNSTVAGVGAIRVLGTNTNSGDPCVDDHTHVTELTIPLGLQLPWPLDNLNGSIELKVIDANSDKDRSVHSADVAVAEVNIYYPLSNWSLELEEVHSEASATPSPDGCDAPPVLEGNAEIGTWIQNGREHKDLDRPGTLEIPGVLAIRVDDVTKTDDSVAARVLMIDLPGDALDIVIGESKASVSC